jgi:hypothetical protein
MSKYFVGVLFFGLSTVGWSDIVDIVNVDQSMSSPIEIDHFNLSLPSADSVTVSLNFADFVVPNLDPTQPVASGNFIARLAQNTGSGWTLDSAGDCDITVNTGATSGHCTATGGFLPDSTFFQLGFEMFDPTTGHQSGNPSTGFWDVTEINLTVNAATVPEPSSALLLLSVFVVAALGLRRHKMISTGPRG